MRNAAIQAFAVLLLLLWPVTAEYNGTLNNNTANTTGIYTGLYAATYGQYCNSNATCVPGDRCFFDYDGTSSGSYAGWCAVSSETRCRHDSTYTSAGSTDVCANTTVKRVCTAGSWENETCTSTNVCSSGSCVAPSATSGTTGPSSSTNTTTNTSAKTYKTASLKIVSSIDVDIVQGYSATKLLDVKNDGELMLYNISAALSGIGNWTTISPSRIANLTINATGTFVAGFVIPKNATVQSYDVTIELSTSNASVKPTGTFKLKVLPSNETVETQITPAYDAYLLLVQELERNITDLQSKGANTTALTALLTTIKEQLSEVNASLAAKDYFKANQLLASVGASMESLKSNVATTELPKPPDYLFFGIVGVVVLAVIGGLAYVLWPVKEAAGYTEKGWSPKEKKEGILDKLKNKFKKKEKQQDEFKYEYKGKK